MTPCNQCTNLPTWDASSCTTIANGQPCTNKMGNVQRWFRIVPKVLEKRGLMVRAKSMMYKTVLYTVLLYGSYIWFIMDAMMKVLEAFCHRIDRSIMG